MTSRCPSLLRRYPCFVSFQIWFHAEQSRLHQSSSLMPFPSNFSILLWTFWKRLRSAASYYSRPFVTTSFSEKYADSSNDPSPRPCSTQSKKNLKLSERNFNSASSRKKLSRLRKVPHVYGNSPRSRMTERQIPKKKDLKIQSGEWKKDTRQTAMSAPWQACIQRYFYGRQMEKKPRFPFRHRTLTSMYEEVWRKRTRR